MRRAPETCFLTGFPTKNRESAIDCIEYHVNIFGKEYYMMFSCDHKNSTFVEENKYVIVGLFANNKFPIPKGNPYYNNDYLEKVIRDAIIPTTPREKIDSLLLHLSSMQLYDGGIISIQTHYPLDFFINKLFFKNLNEFYFYLRTLQELGYVSYIDSSTKESFSYTNLNLTFSGLAYLIEIQTKGKNSRNCFIAMSFSADTSEIRTSIKNACFATGYQPILIDEINIDSEETINDAIVSHIKMSKFLIADFTDQKHGVYFESGLALGYGLPVIYTCHEKDFHKSHFDTNHYPHIIYNNFKKLESDLINKINAWID